MRAIHLAAIAFLGLASATRNMNPVPMPTPDAEDPALVLDRQASSARPTRSSGDSVLRPRRQRPSRRLDYVPPRASCTEDSEDPSCDSPLPADKDWAAWSPTSADQPTSTSTSVFERRKETHGKGCIYEETTYEESEELRTENFIYKCMKSERQVYITEEVGEQKKEESTSLAASTSDTKRQSSTFTKDGTTFFKEVITTTITRRHGGAGSSALRRRYKRSIKYVPNYWWKPTGCIYNGNDMTVNEKSDGTITCSSSSTTTTIITLKRETNETVTGPPSPGPPDPECSLAQCPFIATDKTWMKTCEIWGDPHLRGFDGKVDDYQGTCRRVMVRSSTTALSLYSFLVSTKSYYSATNKRKFSGKRVSFVRNVRVAIHGLTVDLNYGGGVVVDGRRVSLPFVYPPGDHCEGSASRCLLSIQRTGSFGTRLSAYIGFEAPNDVLGVWYDGDHKAQFFVPKQMKGQVEGGCGNYDGDKGNDWRIPSGEIVKNYNVFGASWSIFDDLEVCEDLQTEPEPSCSSAKKREAQTVCKVIKDTSGPFKDCLAHEHMDEYAETYYSACIWDVCQDPGDEDPKAVPCPSVDAWARRCTTATSQGYAWRQSDFCPPKCLDGLEYRSCERACQPSVGQPNPLLCDASCSEGCYCPEGSFLSADGRSCEGWSPKALHCYDDGQQMREDGESWTDSDCGSTCTCSDGVVSCRILMDFSCAEDEVCSSVGGIYQCGCPPGTASRGGQCKPSPPCDEVGPQFCGDNAVCVDDSGEAECVCKAGFSKPANDPIGPCMKPPPTARGCVCVCAEQCGGVDFSSPRQSPEDHLRIVKAIRRRRRLRAHRARARVARRRRTRKQLRSRSLRGRRVQRTQRAQRRRTVQFKLSRTSDTSEDANCQPGRGQVKVYRKPTVSSANNGFASIVSQTSASEYNVFVTNGVKRCPSEQCNCPNVCRPPVGRPKCPPTNPPANPDQPPPPEREPTCEGVYSDIAIIVDSTYSIIKYYNEGKPEYFDMLLRFVANYASHLDVGPNKVRVAVGLFNTGHHHKIGFTEHQTAEELEKAILNLKFSEGRSIGRSLGTVFQFSLLHAESDYFNYGGGCAAPVDEAAFSNSNMDKNAVFGNKANSACMKEISSGARPGMDFPDKIVLFGDGLFEDWRYNKNVLNETIARLNQRTGDKKITFYAVGVKLERSWDKGGERARRDMLTFVTDPSRFWEVKEFEDLDAADGQQVAAQMAAKTCADP